MSNPTLISQPFAHFVTDILLRFEDGKPLTSEQLNFLWRNEKTLNNHALDFVLKYYLHAHQNDPDKCLRFTLPKDRVNHMNALELRDIVEDMLHHELTHVDLHMTLEQFLQFKAAGFRELLFWHGPSFLSRPTRHLSVPPQVLYFQWGKLFGVVKLNTHDDSLILDGNVLIYLEDMNLRSLNQCILDYSHTHKIDHDLTPTPEPKIEPLPHAFSTTPRLQLFEVKRN